MSLYGIRNFLNAKPGEIEKSNQISHSIVQSVNELMRSGKPLIWSGDFMRMGWRFQYNPEKDESPESELKRYLDSLPDRGVMWYYDERRDEYYFEKLSQLNTK